MLFNIDKEFLQFISSFPIGVQNSFLRYLNETAPEFYSMRTNQPEMAKSSHQRFPSKPANAVQRRRIQPYPNRISGLMFS